jgi:HEAT repeat protein
MNCSEDSGLQDLMQQLNTASQCDQAAAKLVLCGRRVIPALQSFLLDGRPSVVYQPRRAAVEALGSLGAKDSLAQYLTSRREIEDAATRFAEESVKNAAARELAKFGTKDVLDLLLDFALPHIRPGIVDALAELASMEAIPYFLRALEDDVCAASAMEGLRKLGHEAELALVTSALTRLPSVEEERPSSLRRRAKVLEALAEMGPSPETWPFLRGLLEESDAGIVTAAAKLAIVLGNSEEKTRAVRGLLAVLPQADWFLREEIRICLGNLYPEAGPLVEKEYARRSELPEQARVQDHTLRLLESVRRRTTGFAEVATSMRIE